MKCRHTCILVKLLSFSKKMSKYANIFPYVIENEQYNMKVMCVRCTSSALLCKSFDIVCSKIFDGVTLRWRLNVRR